MWHAFEVTIEVIPSIVCEASSFGSYPKATIIRELLALDKSLSNIFFKPLITIKHTIVTSLYNIFTTGT